MRDGERWRDGGGEEREREEEKDRGGREMRGGIRKECPFPFPYPYIEFEPLIWVVSKKVNSEEDELMSCFPEVESN